jgi:hypothetical protein
MYLHFASHFHRKYCATLHSKKELSKSSMKSSLEMQPDQTHFNKVKSCDIHLNSQTICRSLNKLAYITTRQAVMRVAVKIGIRR